MKNMRKGQVEGQVLMFLLAVILFGMIVIYGYRAVSTIGGVQQQAALIEFKDRLQTNAKEIALEYGSVKKVPVSVPMTYKEVCFVDVDGLLATDPSAGRFKELGDQKPLLYESVRGGSKQNVFLLPLAETPVILERITIPNLWFCITNKGGPLALRFEGRGDRVAVSPWQE